MGFKVNNFLIIVIREVILEGIGDIYNTNGDVVSGRNGNNKPDCMCCYYCIGGLVKFNPFHLRSKISTMVRAIMVYVVTYLADFWVHNIS